MKYEFESVNRNTKSKCQIDGKRERESFNFRNPLLQKYLFYITSLKLQPTKKKERGRERERERERDLCFY